MLLPPTPKDAPTWLRRWLRWGKLLALYHQYETSGLEHLDGPEAKLIIGYHGRPVAWDLIILGNVLYHRLGYLPHSVVHGGFRAHPVGEAIVRDCGFVTGDEEMLQAVVDKGEHIIVLPGGTREANRHHSKNYTVNWGKRTGFIRLALKYGMQMVPVVCAGVDEPYKGLNNGYELTKKLKVPYDLPAWLGMGPLGPFPISPGWPVKFTQRVGAPIDLRGRGLEHADRDALAAVSLDIQAQVQRLLDETRAEAASRQAG